MIADTQSQILASSLVQSIISDGFILRGKVGLVYGGVSNKGRQFYHVLKYKRVALFDPFMETIYEGTYAMDAADAYVRLAGVHDAYTDAVSFRSEQRRMSVKPNV